MAQTLACLRGWHVPLAQAELSALIPQAEFTQIKSADGYLSTFDDLDGKMVTTLDCSSGIQCFLHDAQIISIRLKISKIADNGLGNHRKFPQRGSLAVRILRIAGKIADLSNRTLAGQIGGIAVEFGFQSISVSQIMKWALSLMVPVTSLHVAGCRRF